MDYLRVRDCVGYTDPDLRKDEVIPGLEMPGESGINRVPGESVREEYRA
jgi:hypothetical protein